MHREIALGISADYKLDYFDTLLKWLQISCSLQCELKPLGPYEVARDGMGIGYRLYVVQAPRDCLQNIVAFCSNYLLVIIKSDSMAVEEKKKTF